MPNGSQNGGQIDAKTCNGKNHENRQKSYFSEWWKFIIKTIAFDGLEGCM